MHLPTTRFLQAPRKIHEPESKQSVPSQVAAHAFDLDERCQLCAGQNADSTDQHGTHDVTESAPGRDAQRLGERPVARLAHCGEYEVVIRAENRMQECDRSRGKDKDLSFSHPLSLRPSLCRTRYVLATSCADFSVILVHCSPSSIDAQHHRILESIRVVQTIEHVDDDVLFVG